MINNYTLDALVKQFLARAVHTGRTNCARPNLVGKHFDTIVFDDVEAPEHEPNETSP